jgi:hypothetical protein
MKGLELCQRFFWEVGLPAIKHNLPECMPRLAAGLSAGSQCHGNDDEVSQDHGWGPGFAVWLAGKDYDRFAQPLQGVLNELPQEYLGYGWQSQPQQTCAVYEIGQYLKSVVGCETAPEVALDWLHIPEECLFEITHRPVFYDAVGEVTRRFESLAQYPEDVWKKRLSACLAWLWSWGLQHLPRAEQREDAITAAMYWCRFATYVMKVGFLLNHRYAPYHKWLYREFLKLPQITTEVLSLLKKGFNPMAERGEVASQIVKVYTQQLARLGYHPIVYESDFGVAYPDNELVRYAMAIRHSIRTPEIKALKLRLEIHLPSWRPTWTNV